MKLCAICKKIQRNPQFKVKAGNNEIVLCEEHKNATGTEALASVIAEDRNDITSWDFLWEGAGVA